MEQQYFARVVVRCTLCKTCVAPMYCEQCHSNLCEDCGKKHSCKIHNIVPLKQYLTSPNQLKCKQHSDKQCQNYCEQCDVPMCAQCELSKEHLGHKQVGFLKKSETKKEILERDLKELEHIIYPRYQHIVSDIKSQKADLCINSQRLITDLDNRGKVWHKEIDSIISNLKSEISETNSKHMAFLDTHENKTTPTLFQIKQVIADIKKILDSKDVSLFSEYKSRNAEFINLPHKVNMSLPFFTFPKINRDRLVEQFGFLSALSFTTEEQDNSIPTQGAESIPQDGSLIGVPQVISDIDTKIGSIYSMACLNDSEIWTRGFGNIMHLYNINGELVKEIQTKSGKHPKDLSLTRCGNLVYTDVDDRSVNIVENAQIQTVIKLSGWIPCCVCCTASDDLLVSMEIDDEDEEDFDYDDEYNDTITKVVRYTGSIEKQSIQFNEKGKPLYSSAVM